MLRARLRLLGYLGVALSLGPRARAAQPESAGDRAPPSSHASNAPVSANIEIERTAGAEACPDSAAVFESLARLFPERKFHVSSAPAEHATRAHVVVRPLTPGYEAVVRVLEPRLGERVIIEEDDDCRGLADALAVGFMLLVEPPGSSTEGPTAAVPPASSGPSAMTAPAPQPPPKPSPRVAREPATAHESPPSPKRRARAELAVSGIAGLGLLSEPSLGAAAGVEVSHASGWGLSLRGVRLWAQSAQRDGGKVTLSSWGFFGGPCFRRRLNRGSSLEACLQLGVGSQYAEVEGFFAPASGSFPWMLLVPSVGFRSNFSEILSGFARIGPVAGLRPQGFSVRVGDGSGTTREVAGAPTFGVMAELGLAAGGSVF
jgi:hypothetical protein